MDTSAQKPNPHRKNQEQNMRPKYKEPNPKKNKPKTNQEIKTSNKPHRTTFSP
jgi:hypothetical protein